MDYESFQHAHSAQLSTIPKKYWRALYEKLQNEVYDAGKYFCISPSDSEEDSGWNVLVSCEDGVNSDDPSCIFLVDHAWTFQAEYAERQLRMVNGLAVRMGALMGLTTPLDEGEGEEEGAGSYDADSESGNEKEAWSESDEEGENSKPGTSFEDSTLQLQFQSHDAPYDSGDLGDVSCAFDAAAKLDTRSKRKRKVKLKKSGSDDAKEQQNEEKSPEERGLSAEGRGQLDTKGSGLQSSFEAVGEEAGGEGVAIVLPSDDLVKDILREMWRYCRAYHISNSLVPMWYVLDEFGSKIRHSLNPTVAMLPFIHIPTQLAYTVFWPLKDLNQGDFVTCNFLPESVQAGLNLACHSLLWSPDCHISLDDPLWSELDEFEVPELKERCNEEIPDPATPSPSPMLNYSVYTDMKLVENHLTLPAFHCVSSRKGADILWLADHFKNFRSLEEGQFINQFPCENVLTCKDLMAAVARRGNHGNTPEWLPLTYNLLYELPKLVRNYLERKEREEDNWWIVKPWNLGRGLGIHVTDNLRKIICLAQSGPKIVSKYISDPVLFHRPELGWVKFDYRYMILLTSVKPLEMYIYNVFWLRFANKPYTLEDPNDYEIHFTVMNYKPDVVLKQIDYDDFIPLFEEQHPGYKWSDIQKSTCQVLKEMFESATAGTPPNAVAPFGQSRAIYAADLMLEKVPSQGSAPPTFKPRLLELNYSPDNRRACKYHPDFYNHMFQVLFMGTSAGLPVTKVV